ncbi:MAG: hypothetical protein Q4F84_04195 [Fibrobacter sp.]|nr:hypothetical protein [Fibrobacter sp.]
MKKIPVDKIEPGMILGRNVRGPSGGTLLMKGLCLTTALGRRLKNWGISSIYVEGEDDKHPEYSSNFISSDKLKEHLTDKFSRVIDNSIMKKIFVAAYQYHLQKSK